MKKLVMFVSIVSAALVCPAYAQQGGSLAALRYAAAGITPALPAVPAAQPAAGAVAGGLLKAAVPADLADLNAGQAAALALAARAAGIAVFELDGAQMKTKPELMTHAARALGFPGDFGRNSETAWSRRRLTTAGVAPMSLTDTRTPASWWRA